MTYNHTQFKTNPKSKSKCLKIKSAVTSLHVPIKLNNIKQR